MQHATPARTPRTGQPSLRKQKAAAPDTIQQLRAVLRSSSRTDEYTTEDRQQAQEKLLQESSSALRQTGTTSTGLAINPLHRTLEAHARPWGCFRQQRKGST
ncbi:hypothetical protein WJX84_004231 [Apatococcus fuscideae]|uniref:Uncharacterized protein n=1 Tax=Apatococcus fuscideae TaxID=2026836 RepID=A0AAW1SMG9_9CHLO